MKGASIAIYDGVFQIVSKAGDCGQSYPQFVFVGTRRYFVDAVDSAGNRVSVWDGETYAGALDVASRMVNFGPIEDTSRGSLQ